MYESSRESFPDVRNWSGGPPGCPGVVEMSGRGREASRLYGCGREALPDVREWTGGPPGCPGVVGRPSRMSRCGREALPYVQE